MESLIGNIYLGLLDFIPSAPYFGEEGNLNEEETIFLIKEWIVDIIHLGTHPKEMGVARYNNINIFYADGWKFSFDRTAFSPNEALILDNIQKYVNGEWC